MQFLRNGTTITAQHWVESEFIPVTTGSFIGIKLECLVTDLIVSKEKEITITTYIYITVVTRKRYSSPFLFTLYCARRFYIDRLRIWRDVSICGNPVTQIVRDPKWKFCGNVAKTVYVASGATNTNDGEVVESGEPAKCSYIVAIYRWPLSINISFLIKNKVFKIFPSSPSKIHITLEIVFLYFTTTPSLWDWTLGIDLVV